MLRQHCENDECENQRRHRHHQVVEAGEKLIDEAAGDGRGEAQDHTESEGYHGCRQRDEDRRSSAVDQTREQVAAEIVRAEEEIAAGRQPDIAHHLALAKGGEKGSKEGAENCDSNADDADPGTEGYGSQVHRGCLNLGLARMARMSAAMLRKI